MTAQVVTKTTITTIDSHGVAASLNSAAGAVTQSNPAFLHGQPSIFNTEPMSSIQGKSLLLLSN